MLGRQGDDGCRNISQTDFGYTGQRALDNGLMDYHARFYDASLGRFVQPDSIVQNPANPQDFNRFAYVINNPIVNIDPTGNIHCDGYQCKIAQNQMAKNNGNGSIDRSGNSTSSNQYCREHPGICYGFNSGNPDGGGESGLNFDGYSDWEEQVLTYIYDNGGPYSRDGVDYILAHKIHIEERTGWQSYGGTRGAWFEGDNLVVINTDDPGNFYDPIRNKGNINVGGLNRWGLSQIIHEARHIEQGDYMSHSKLGEMDAWQVQFHVRQELGASRTTFTWSQLDDDIMNATTLDEYVDKIKSGYADYWSKNGIGLVNYPDYPANMCMNILGCGPVLPWPFYIHP